MAFDICFSVDCYFDSLNKTFMSPICEEYVVNMKRWNQYHSSTNYEITLSWKRKSRRLLKFISYSESNRSKHHEVIVFVNENDLTTSCRSLQLPGTKYVILINVIPCDDISKSLNEPTASNVKQNVTKVEPVVERRLEHLSSDFGNLFQTAQFSDVVLTDGSKEIRAHKLILSVRSSVFCKMLQNPMKESKENRITIKEIPIEVLKSLLTFMYTGTVQLSDMKMARNLYIAADKYDVKNLKNICSEMLKSVNLNSVLDTLLLADLYQDTQLKQAALNFIAINYSHLKTLSNWNKFLKENQSLAIEILSFVVDKKV